MNILISHNGDITIFGTINTDSIVFTERGVLITKKDNTVLEILYKDLHNIIVMN